MASFYSTCQDIGRQFICLDDRPENPAILAVLLGGSSIYLVGDSEEAETYQRPDWDGAILMPTKLAIFNLVNEQRPSLMKMLKIAREESPDLQVPEPSSKDWNQFDAVRFAGFDSLGFKQSVKIVSLDYFSKLETSLRILSFKDKRIFKADRLLRAGSYLIQQANRLTTQDLFILHDSWVPVSLTAVCVHGQEPPSGVFGITMDLLLTGIWLYGHEPHGRFVQSKILAHYRVRSGRNPTIRTFARSCRFSVEYSCWLAGQLASFQLSQDTSDSSPKNSDCECGLQETNFVYGEANSLNGLLTVPTQNAVLATGCVEIFERQQHLARFKRPPSSFSSNSMTFEVVLPNLDGKLAKIFCKRSQYLRHEIQGAANAAKFYPGIQRPQVASSGELLYPFFEGKTESESRLLYRQSGRSDWNAAEIVLYAELVKAQDMLCAYKTCLESGNESMPTSESAAQPIHRFFYSRLVQHARLREFYGDTLAIGGKRFSLAEFLEFRWKVNRIEFPSLAQLFRTAIDVVDPTSQQYTSCPWSFGLGDSHGANVMVANNVSPNNGREVLYVDYEVAGFHPTLLDLAKPLYIDVFFDTLYMDDLPDTPKLRYEIEGDLINVDFAPLVDDLTQAIFDIKRRYLIQPLFEICPKLEEGIPLLSNALFLCATLTRNFVHCPEAFLRNMATGILLSIPVDSEELHASFRLLGLKT